MDLAVSIESAEKQFKQILEEFFISVYNEKSLSSHGLDHHRRVWNYSKELLQMFSSKNSVLDIRLASELIIVSYLHDLGMSVDQGIKHGKHSRDLCVRFLTNLNLLEKDFSDVLYAIENHDNKDYTLSTPGNDLLKILSVADDLDAFGYNGIFRYSEIYLKRGISPGKIGHIICENAEKRFGNLVKTFGSFTIFLKKHSERYYILENFFSNYNRQLSSYHFGSAQPKGYCGVIEIFLFLINNNLQLNDCFPEPEKYSHDEIILWYFTELEKELSGF